MKTPLRALIVEDSPEDAELLIRQLRSDGYDPTFDRVDTAEAMAAALGRQEWDVVISDFVMPRFSGPDALKLVQGRKLDLPFIIVSGIIGEEAAVNAMKAGAHDYMRKDDLARLAVAITREIRDAAQRRQQRAAESALQASEQRFHQMADVVPSVFWIAALDQSQLKYLYVNPAYEEIFGRSCQSLLAEPASLSEAVHPDDRERVADESQRMIDGKPFMRDIEFRIVRPDGTVRWVRSQTYEIAAPPDAGRTTASVARRCGIIQDVTEQKRLEKEVLEISASEQRRIGQDLHDVLGQDLTGIAFMVKLIQQKLEAQSLPEATDAANIGKMVTQAIVQARALAKGLCPVNLAAEGLMSALQTFANSIESLFGVTCRFNCEQAVLMHDNVAATHLFHIAQEAVNNAIKHGQARQIEISLANPAAGKTVLRVQDDGAGIPDKPKNPGMGLNIMSYRARMIGGILSVQGLADGGTAVTCSLRTRPNDHPTERIVG